MPFQDSFLGLLVHVGIGASEARHNIEKINSLSKLMIYFNAFLILGYRFSSPQCHCLFISYFQSILCARIKSRSNWKWVGDLIAIWNLYGRGHLWEPIKNCEGMPTMYVEKCCKIRTNLNYYWLLNCRLGSHLEEVQVIFIWNQKKALENVGKLLLSQKCKTRHLKIKHLKKYSSGVFRLFPEGFSFEPKRTACVLTCRSNCTK